MGSLPGAQCIHKVVIHQEKQRTTKQVGHYTLIGKIGRGISSKVFVSEDIKTSRFVAVKSVKLSGRQENEMMLRREIRTMERVAGHPNIVRLYEALFSQEKSTVYLILELADGGTLAELTKQVKLTESQLRHIYKQAVSALIHVHTIGIVHRDVKPANILLFTDGSAKLSDFGIGTSFESAEAVVGSPAYQAPELFEESWDAEPTKGDVWSLGVSIFESFFGKLPFQGANLYEIVNYATTEGLVIPDGASDDLKDLITQMLTIDPSQRISMQDVARHPFFTRDEYQNEAFDIKIEKKVKMKPRANDVVVINAVKCDSMTAFKRDVPPFSWPRRFSK